MEFKQGHYYRTGNGTKVQYIGKTDFCPQMPHIFVHQDDATPYLYYSDGQYQLDEGGSGLDIMEEWYDDPQVNS